MKFELQLRKAKIKFHCLALVAFHISSLSNAKEEMKTNMDTYLADLTVIGMKHTKWPTKVSPYTVYRQNNL